MLGASDFITRPEPKGWSKNSACQAHHIISRCKNLRVPRPCLQVVADAAIHTPFICVSSILAVTSSPAGARRSAERSMDFKHLVEAAEKWCTGNPFDLIFAEEDDERRLDFYAEPGVSFYVLCPGGTDTFHVWSESEDCLPFLQMAQDYISSCGKKTLPEVLEKVFMSFRPLLGLPDIDDDTFEHYHADMEGEPGPDHQQMGVSQQ